jgi:hypothetical protein
MAKLYSNSFTQNKFQLESTAFLLAYAQSLHVISTGNLYFECNLN